MNLTETIKMIQKTGWYNEVDSYKVLAFLTGYTLCESKRLWMYHTTTRITSGG